MSRNLKTPSRNKRGQKSTWEPFKHPQDPSVWFSLAPPLPPKKTQRPTSKKHEKTWCVSTSSRLAQRSKFQPSWFPGPLRNHSSQRQEHLALDPAHAGHEPPQGQPQRSRPNTAVPGQRLPLPLNLEKCHKKPLRRPETETLHAQRQRIKKSCSMVFLWNFERLLWVAALLFTFLRKSEDRWTWLVVYVVWTQRPMRCMRRRSARPDCGFENDTMAPLSESGLSTGF